MAKEKRTKPCSNCKRSKVKCIYTNTLPCERCIKTGQGSHCQFVPKLPSLKLPPLSNSEGHELSLPPLGVTASAGGANTSVSVSVSGSSNSISSGSSSLKNGTAPLPSTSLSSSQFLIPTNSISNHAHTTNNDGHWRSQMEDRMNNVDNKLNDLVDILKMNQQYLLESQRRTQQHSLLQSPYYNHAGVPLPSPPPPPPPPPVSVSPVSMGHRHQLNPTNIYPASRIYSPIQHQSQAPTPPLLQPSSSNSNTNTSTNTNASTNTNTNTRHESHKRPHSYTQPTAEGKPPKKHKSDELPEDFRNGFLSKEEATELFTFFDTNISQQLFGFEISKISIDSIWDSCPLLVCAICSISSIHHPELSAKSSSLQSYLHNLCSTILFKGRPKNETDGFNTIVALVFCSFWLTDSQMFTGLALQLAKEFGMNNPYTTNKDKLKLWYLLYILDGQQSLTFNRQPLVNAQEYSLKNSREILLSDKLKLKPTASTTNLLIENKDGEKDDNYKDRESESESESERLTDMRLVSQVEYNQALNEAFKGNAWDLLMPSSFGIPSKSNLELDRWMVSWTVLLAPGNHGAVWSSKSTLIYYNFAKMHINSSAVRQLQINPSDEKSMLPKWESTVKVFDKRIESSNDSNDHQTEEEDEFISNKELMSEDETIVSANIAVNAAQTVLNLVINDNDILDNLKYVPVHIHIMLYYAALLLINPPIKSNNKSIELSEKDYHLKVLQNLEVVKNLQKKIYTNLPIDTKFGNRLIRSLDEMIEEKLAVIREKVKTFPDEDRILLERGIMALADNSKNIVEIFDHDSSHRGSTPERIAAWPGSNHGHP